MKLYSGPLSMFGAKAEIAALEKGVPVEVEHVPFDLENFYDPKHPDVVRINPKQEVPVLIDGSVEIFDSTQIFEYLEDRWPDPPLWPASPAERAGARLWELKSDEVFFPNVVLLMPRRRAEAGEDAVRDGIARLHAYYDAANTRLQGREYFAEAFSYADIAFYMAHLFAAFLGEPCAPGHEALERWRTRVGRRDSVVRVAGAMVKYLESHGIPSPVRPGE